ncbi:MAG: hypothetical protein AAF404_05200 [Pseudomonadota bacterium]
MHATHHHCRIKGMASINEQVVRSDKNKTNTGKSTEMFTTLNTIINRAIYAGFLFGVAFPITAVLTVLLMQGLSTLSIPALLLGVLAWLLFFGAVYARITNPYNFIRLRSLPLHAIRRF